MPEEYEKARAPSNRIGAEGEGVFVRVATQHGLLPTKIAEDVGLDFVCEVDEDPKSPKASHISGALIGSLRKGDDLKEGTHRPKPRRRIGFVALSFSSSLWSALRTDRTASTTGS